MEIEIKNWDKYNPRKDIKNPSWFALSNRMIEDSDIYELNDKEFKAWVYCLSQASIQNKRGFAEIDFRHASRVCGVNRDSLNAMLEKMAKTESVHIRTHPYAALRADATHGPYITDITDITDNTEIVVCYDSPIHEHPLDTPCATKPPNFTEKANEVATHWNELAELNNLPKVKLPLSPDRLKAMKPALDEFKAFDDWHKIICAVADNEFNLGVNDRKWKANFDWIFHKTKFNYRKLWESSID